MSIPPLLPHRAESEALKLVRAENATKLMTTALMLVVWLNLPDKPPSTKTEAAA